MIAVRPVAYDNNIILHIFLLKSKWEYNDNMANANMQWQGETDKAPMEHLLSPTDENEKQIKTQ